MLIWFAFQFTCFILIVLGLEYLQLYNYQPHSRYRSTTQQLELTVAWHDLEKQPQSMQQYEQQHHCCGYNNASDYKAMHLSIPKSCYQLGSDEQLFTRGCLTTLKHSHSRIEQSDKLFIWCIIGLEVKPSRSCQFTDLQ